MAAATGNRKGRLPTAVTGLPIPSVAAATGLSPFRTSGQVTFFQYLAPATDTTGAGTAFAHERATRLNPQLHYYYGPFGLLAEYLWLKQGVQKGTNTAQLTQQSAHATVSFTIGGTDGYEGPTPEHPFDLAERRLGALQIAARYGWLGIDDCDVSRLRESGGERAVGPGVCGGPRLGAAAFAAPRGQLRADALPGRGGDRRHGNDRGRHRGPADRASDPRARTGELLRKEPIEMRIWKASAGIAVAFVVAATGAMTMSPWRRRARR